jgi:hypothetical protein
MSGKESCCRKRVVGIDEDYRRRGTLSIPIYDRPEPRGSFFGPMKLAGETPALPGKLRRYAIGGDRVVALFFQFEGKLLASGANNSAIDQHVHKVRDDII